MEYILLDEAVRGPVNLTAPRPVTNREFIQTLGRVLRRPTLLPAPALLLRAALGEMADEVLLAG
ncbi:MAG: TIGR01777 family protein, partial [bacterium]